MKKAAKGSKATKAKVTAAAPKREALEKLVGKGRVRYRGKLVEVLATKPNPRDRAITDVKVAADGDGKATWVSGRSVEIAPSPPPNGGEQTAGALGPPCDI